MFDDIESLEREWNHVEVEKQSMREKLKHRINK
jgi:hypothetical protein